MKKVLFILALLFCSVAIGQVTPVINGAKLVISTTVQIQALPTPSRGEMQYSSTTDTIWTYNGTIWVDSGSGAASLPVSDATSIVEDPVDGTKEMRIDVGAVTTATIRVLTMPDEDVDLADRFESTVTGEPSGSDRMENVVSLTQSEYDAGTPVATTLYVVTDAKAYSYPQIAISDLTTSLTTGDVKGFWIAPADGTIESPTNNGVAIYLLTAGTVTGVTMEIDKNGSDITTTGITTDATENDSDDAATDFVLTTYTFVRGDKFEFNLDAVPTAGAGAIVTLKVYYD